MFDGFVRGGFTNYDLAVSNLLLDPSALDQTDRNLNVTNAGVIAAWGRTNPDGSIELLFEDSNYYNSFMYYTGTNLACYDGRSNVVYFKTGPRYYFEVITNHWYLLDKWP